MNQLCYRIINPRSEIVELIAVCTEKAASTLKASMPTLKVIGLGKKGALEEIKKVSILTEPHLLHLLT